MENIEKGHRKLDLVNHWISNCDTKSSFIFTFFGVVLTIIFSSSIGEEMIGTFSFTQANETNLRSFGNFILLLTTFSFFIASILTLLQIYLTLKGRINPKIYQENGLRTDSNIFFGSVASKPFGKYEIESNDESNGAYLNDLNSQVYINSKIAERKFNHYNKSLFWLFISLGMFILFVILR